MYDEIAARRRTYWDRQSVNYDKAMGTADRLIFKDSRQWVCSRATGRTLEVGIGTGMNLPFYPAEVELVGIELSPRMLAIAKSRAGELRRPVDLDEGDARAMPFEPESFDTVVATFVLCAVPDVRETLVEIDRVLRPGGSLLLGDHVRPSNPPLRWLLTAAQKLADRFSPDGGEQFLRRPFEEVQAIGYQIDERERFRGGLVERLRATKPR